MGDNKVMTCITENTVRALIKDANELNIKKEDIVNMFPLGGQIYLIYYK